MKMTEDIRQVWINEIGVNGEYVGLIPIHVKSYKNFELYKAFDGKWYLMAESFDKDLKQWIHQKWGPLQVPIETFTTFENEIVSIKSLRNNPEDIQEFLEEYLITKAIEIKKITKRI